MIKYSPFIFFVISTITFLDYDFYPFVMLIFLLFLFFYNEAVFNVNTWIKKLIQIQVFAFLLVVRFFPIYFLNFLPLFNKTAQQNYLIGDGRFFAENIFLDLQNLLFSLSCNGKKSFKNSEYVLRFSGYENSNNILECPQTANYGYIFNFIKISKEHIWPLTLLIAFISLLLIYIIYLKISKNLLGKDFLIITAVFLSPPVNFLIFRLNFDLLIFLCIYFIYEYCDKKFILKISLLFLLVLFKFYPVFLIFSELLTVVSKKDIKKSLYASVLILSSIFYLIYNRTNIESISYFIKPTESNRSFGLLNDFLFIKSLFSIEIILFICLFLGFLLITFYSHLNVRNFYIDSIEFNFMVFFLITFIFINYDYRLVFLIFFFRSSTKYKNKILYFSILFFMYTSPSLLHAYVKYDVIQNNLIYVLDFSFYLLFVIFFKSSIEYYKTQLKRNNI